MSWDRQRLTVKAKERDVEDELQNDGQEYSVWQIQVDEFHRTGRGFLSCCLACLYARVSSRFFPLLWAQLFPMFPDSTRERVSKKGSGQYLLSDRKKEANASFTTFYNHLRWVDNLSEDVFYSLSS
jgi:hypothetical protein